MSNQQRFSSEWETKRLGDLLSYKRPDPYIVKSTEYVEHGDIPVLTANKAFILGYTDELFGICEKLPAIVFDDFTTDNKYAEFPFKVKSSAIKLLYPKHVDVNLRFVFARMQLIDFPLGNHKRYYISEYQNLELPVPDYEEQRAIAEVLSDVDGLINALDALIAKKRAIKQATMQQLLTGKTRLPGFSGAWETKRIGDLLSYKRPDPYIVKSTEYVEHGDVPVLTANKAFILGYTDELFGICEKLPAIVFDDFTTDNKYAAFPFKVKSSAIKLLYPKHEGVNLRFVFERMQLIDYPLGNHKRYFISEYQNIKLPVPDYEEQRAIATVLSDIDAEIVALEHRRDKTIAIKQGMMQQLLTGKVRLLKSGVL